MTTVNTDGGAMQDAQSETVFMHFVEYLNFMTRSWEYKTDMLFIKKYQMSNSVYIRNLLHFFYGHRKEYS